MHILGAIAEFERARIAERAKAGLARAKANGRRLGRPRLVVGSRCCRQSAASAYGRRRGRLGVSTATAHRWLRARVHFTVKGHDLQLILAGNVDRPGPDIALLITKRHGDRPTGGCRFDRRSTPIENRPRWRCPPWDWDCRGVAGSVWTMSATARGNRPDVASASTPLVMPAACDEGHRDDGPCICR